jgi:hypothetical protein
MSMTKRPRNPRYFPKMKVRGKRRRIAARYQRVARAADLFSAACASTGIALSAFSIAVSRSIEREAEELKQ